MIGGVEARSDGQVHKAKVTSGKVSKAGKWELSEDQEEEWLWLQDE